MKAILVLEMPSSCSKCKLKSRLNCEIEGVTHCCNLAEGMITLDKGFEKRLPNCPLKPMPEKKEDTDNILGVFMNIGRNACIDEILGDKE